VGRGRAIAPGFTPFPAAEPLVSVLIPTRDRPEFLAVALECWRRQTYANRQVIVLDHGAERPVDPAAVNAAGAFVARIPPSLTLGEALNAGVKLAAGPVCLKADDDDWYGPTFLDEWLDRFTAVSPGGEPALVCATTYLLFDVRRWQIRRGQEGRFSGATLCFSREAALRAPFRPYARYEDAHFYRDQHDAGARLDHVWRPTSYLAVRHDGGAANRSHTWTDDDGVAVSDLLLELDLEPVAPEELISPWALPFYQRLRRQLADAPPDGISPRSGR
jgi:glycosyltransferase involved in cell wall biosynthesis